MSVLAIKPTAHVVDVLGNVIGRDQPILRMEKALEMTALLGEVFADDDVVFFDPFCKAGELLLACAFHSCWARTKGKSKILDLDMVMTEIYHSNRYFGLAPDERHHRLSVRTFLGNEHSHEEKFNHVIRDGHYLSERDGRLDKEKFEREFNSMIEYINSKTDGKKIIVVGNPPYQENDGGGNGTAAMPIYQLFTKALIDSNDICRFVLVIPSRWFAGGRGLDKFRDMMINSRQIRSITHFEKSAAVFPTVDIDGGVCFLNYDRHHDGSVLFIDGLSSGDGINLNLQNFDIIPDDPKAIPILEKVQGKWGGGQWVSDTALRGRAFGPRTFHFKRFKAEDRPFSGSIPCIGNGRVLKHIERSAISRNDDFISRYKVCVPGVYGGQRGDRRMTLPARAVFVVDAGTIVTETYMVVHSTRTKKAAERFAEYLKTDFARYLLGLRKLTANISWERWKWVPLLKMNQDWSDNDIFDFFGLSKAERLHIKKKVQEWS